MELKIDTDVSLYNSVGSDSRYGRGKNYFKDNDTSYFITVREDHATIVKALEDRLAPIFDVENVSVDDFIVLGDTIYCIAMKDQALQEFYKVENNEIKKLTSFNEEVMKDYYVAKPEKLTVKKAVDIDGWVLKPIGYDANKKYPAILDIHGGPKTAYGIVYYHEMQYWASKGYFVMYCNPRGSDGKGNQFEEYNIGAHSGMRIDIADGNINLKIVSTQGAVLLDKMVKNGKADKKMIYITTGIDD